MPFAPFTPVKIAAVSALFFAVTLGAPPHLAAADEAEDARALCQRAHATEETGLVTKAISQYSECLAHPALTPEDKLLALNFQARLLRKRGDYADAIAGHSAAYELDKNAALSLLMRGNTHAHFKHYDRAVEDFSNALVLAPNSSVALNNRAESYFGLGDYVRAVKDYDALVRREPGNAELRAKRCRALALGGNGEAAITDCDRALAEFPRDGRLHDSRAIALFRLGNFSDALNAADRAVSLGAEPRWQVLLHRGLILARLGLHKKAWQALDQSLSRAPSDGVVITRLRELNLFSNIHQLPNAQEIIDAMKK